MRQEKEKKWGWRNSLWILWTFTLGMFNYVAFYYIGIRTKQVKWILAGVVYSIVFIVVMILIEYPAYEDVTSILLVSSWLASMVHAFMVRKEYLVRMEVLSANREKDDLALRRRIEREYQGQEKSDLRKIEKEYSGRSGSTSFPPVPDSLKEKPLETEPNSASNSFTPEKKVDPNTATEDELADLPGMNRIIARKALELRREQGRFASMDDFYQRMGLKPHIVERLRPLMDVEPSQSQPASSMQAQQQGRVIDY